MALKSEKKSAWCMLLSGLIMVGLGLFCDFFYYIGCITIAVAVVYLIFIYTD